MIFSRSLPAAPQESPAQIHKRAYIRACGCRRHAASRLSYFAPFVVLSFALLPPLAARFSFSLIRLSRSVSRSRFPLTSCFFSPPTPPLSFFLTSSPRPRLYPPPPSRGDAVFRHQARKFVTRIYEKCSSRYGLGSAASAPLINLPLLLLVSLRISPPGALTRAKPESWELL